MPQASYKTNPREEVIQCRVTYKEKKKLKQLADHEGLTVSNLVYLEILQLLGKGRSLQE